MTVLRTTAVLLALIACITARQLWTGRSGMPSVPASCNALGKTCGTLTTASGETLDCGACSRFEVCGADGVANVCCAPTSCDEQRATCGEMSDGCGGTLDCGACADGEVCGGGGTANVCGAVASACVPVRCADVGAECGRISDGCGGILECGGCGAGTACGGASVPNVCGKLRSELSTALAGSCLGQPERAPSPRNFITARTHVAAGMQAIDFTLTDVDGRPFTLSEALATKPVLLELASDSCNVFQANRARMDALAERYADELWVVTIYTVEAHPIAPDPSPYRGRVFTLPTSATRQARSWDERLADAQGLEVARPRRVLVDRFDDAVWCTYGPAPNAAFLIAQDGLITAAHTWLDMPTMERSVESLLTSRRTPVLAAE